MMFARLGKNYCATGVRDNDLRCKMFSTYSRRRALFQNIFRPFLRPYYFIQAISEAIFNFFRVCALFPTSPVFFLHLRISRLPILSILARSLRMHVFADHFQSLYPA